MTIVTQGLPTNNIIVHYCNSLVQKVWCQQSTANLKTQFKFTAVLLP